MKPIQLIALFVSASISALAIAQPPEGGPGGFGGGRNFRIPNPLLAAIDKDKDGILSAEEIENATASLKTLDKNNDGKLDQSETRPNFESMGPGGFGGGAFGGGGFGGGQGDGAADQLVARLMEMDKDKYGKLSKDELPERLQSMMARGDKNDDGFLDKAEIMASARERSGGQGGQGGRFGAGGFGGGPFGGGAEFVGQLIQRADTDKDGKLSADELPPFMRERIEQIDTNKDGAVDKAELEAGMSQMRGAFGGGGRREGNKDGRKRPALEEDDKEKPKSDDASPEK